MKSERGKKTRRSRKKEERKGGEKKRKFLRGERKVFVEMIGFVALVDNHGFIGIVVYVESIVGIFLTFLQSFATCIDDVWPYLTMFDNVW